MLWIATFLQHLHHHLHAETAGLSEPPRQMMNRLVDTCIRLVTMNDDLLGSIEGLECVMIESMYHTNGGNLRKGLPRNLGNFHPEGYCHRVVDGLPPTWDSGYAVYSP